MPKPDSAYRALNRAVGKALHRYAMIADGDHVLVGLSGGADSLSLLWLLNERRRRIPIDYRLTAVFVDPGFEQSCAEVLKDHCDRAGLPLRVEHTDFGPRAHSGANTENPCFLCSRLRRRRLFEIAGELGCRKLALGHNKDDIIETLFLNMCYAGEISTMLPLQSMFDGAVEVIRPLAYADKALIRKFAQREKLPVFRNPCPSAQTSRRRHIRLMLEKLYKSNPKIKGNLFRSIHRVKLDYLPAAVESPDDRRTGG